MIGVTELAEELGIDPGDVRVLLAQLDEHADPVSDGLGAEIRDQLDPSGADRAGAVVAW